MTKIMAPETGCFLISNSALSDPNFFRTVILLCHHDEDGSFGLVLNQPLPLSLANGLTELGGWDAPIRRGGPVQTDSLHFLHTDTSHEIGGQEVIDGVFWGGDFERVNSLASQGDLDPDDFRFFAGYSGWSGGQLAEEMKHESWYVTPAQPEFIMSPAVETLWKDVLASMGPEYALISRIPPDPRVN